jgi:hypothetical protein
MQIPYYHRQHLLLHIPPNRPLDLLLHHPPDIILKNPNLISEDFVFVAQPVDELAHYEHVVDDEGDALGEQVFPVDDELQVVEGGVLQLQQAVGLGQFGGV